MTILQISVPDKKEKAVRILLKELGVSVKKLKPKNTLLTKIKKAVNELNDVKEGKVEAKDLDSLIDEL